MCTLKANCIGIFFGEFLPLGHKKNSGMTHINVTHTLFKEKEVPKCQISRIFFGNSHI
jgi:hypothetical protein